MKIKYKMTSIFETIVSIVFNKIKRFIKFIFFFDTQTNIELEYCKNK